MDQQTAASIQAVAAVAQVVLAFVLWRATVRYVRLTHSLSEAADRQLVLLRQSDLHARRADLVDLSGLTQRLRMSLDELPRQAGEPNWGASLRTAPLWTAEDIRTFASLAAKAGNEFAMAASAAANDLVWIRDQLIPIRDEDPRQGYAISNFRWDDYRPRVERVHAALGKMQEEASATVKSLMAT